MASDASLIVRNFSASLRPDVGDPFETVRTCFQMLTVLPASRRAVLDHMASIFLNPRSELVITRERDEQLMAIVAELSLKDWSHILGDWCCQVLARSRAETPKTAFIEKLLVNCYKSGLESGTQLDWLHPTLLNAPFASRNIFSDLLRRFVANFSQNFVTGLVRCAMTVYKQQGQVNIFAIGHALDHLGHGFPGELQKIVDELLSTDQFSVQLLLDIAQIYPQICAIFQARLAWRLSAGADFRDMIQLFNAQPPQGKQSNLLKRCLFTRSPVWWQLFRSIVSAYCCPPDMMRISTQMFAKIFLEELANLIGGDNKQLLVGMPESDVTFLFERALISSGNRTLDAKLLSNLVAISLLNVGRPGDMIAQTLFSDKCIFKPDSSIEFAAFYAILISVSSRNGNACRQFASFVIEKVQTEEGRGRIWALKQLLETEREQNAVEMTTILSLSTIFAQNFADFLGILADSEGCDSETVSLIVELVASIPDSSSVTKSPYTEKGGLAVVLQIAGLLKSQNVNLERRILLEKLMFLLYVYLNFWLTRQSSSISLLLLDGFVRTCFDCNNSPNNGNKNCLETNKANQTLFLQTVKILLCPPQNQNLARNSTPRFDQGCIWRLQLGQPDPNSLVFLAKLLVQTISPDIIHVVVSSGFEWSLDSAIENNQPIPVDYREYCLKIRMLVTVTCPFLLDFLSFFVSISTTTANNLPIVILLPLFRALLYAALCCVTASVKSTSLGVVNLQFIVRVLTLLQQARLLAAPLCHLPSILPQIEPSQLAIILRAAWPLLINVKTGQTTANSAQAVAPILTILKSKLSNFAQILPLFETSLNNNNN